MSATHDDLTVGTVVTVETWDRDARAFTGTAHMRVTRPLYMIDAYGESFVGMMLDGPHAGTLLVEQLARVTHVDGCAVPR